MIEDGSETSNGVDYDFMFSNEGFFGCYQLLVPEMFFDELGRQLSTKEFKVGGHTWWIQLEFGLNGRLVAFLCSHNQSTTDVHLAFTLENRDKQKSVSKGDLCKFQPGTRPVAFDLASITEIRNEAGYLRNSVVMVKMEMRLKEEENESFLFFSEDNDTFAWALRNLYGRSPCTMRTEEFEIGESKWQLEINPYGRDRNSRHLSFFIRSCNPSVVTAKACISVLNRDSKKDMLEEFEFTFNQDADEGGCSKFLEMTKLEDEAFGFQSKGWIILTAQILVQNPPPAVSDARQGSSVQSSPGPGIGRELPSCPESVRQSATSPADTSMQSGLNTLRAFMQSENASFPLTKFLVEASASLRHLHIEGQPETACSEIIDPTMTTGSTTIDREDSGDLDFCIQNDPFTRLRTLIPGTKFANRYTIGKRNVKGRKDLLSATDQFSDSNVILKFYPSRESFDKCKELYETLSSDYVCKPLNYFIDDKLPPCLIFERGIYTLDKWIQMAPTESVKKDVIREVLECLIYIHSHNVVHCNINPSNIAFFKSSRSWKLLNTDAGLEEGEHYSSSSYTIDYAAPEKVQAEEDDQPMVAQRSMDMWAFGIVAYEVLTGRRFYGNCATEAFMKDCLLGRQELPSLKHVRDSQIQQLLINLLSLMPERRWNAQMALNRSVCTAECTAQTAGFRRTAGRAPKERPLKEGSSYEMKVSDLTNFTVGTEVESKVFEIRKKWSIGLLHHKDNSGNQDIMSVVLTSHNHQSISAHVELCVQLNGQQRPSKPFGRTRSVAEPFGLMINRPISVDQLTLSGGFQQNDQLSITVDCKNVKEATEADRKEAREKDIGPSSKTVTVKVISERNIEDLLLYSAFGLASSESSMSSENLRHCSQVRPWVTQSENCRYWLCGWDEAGDVYIEQFLNEAPLLTHFGGLSGNDSGGIPQVTLFKEEKEEGQQFEKVNKDTIVVFCKRFRRPRCEVEYAGLQTVDKMMLYTDLLPLLAKMAGFYDTEKYNAYIEIPGQRIQDITFIRGPLPEHENKKSYIVILTERDPDKDAEQLEKEVCEKLVQVHQKGKAKKSAEQESMETSSPVQLTGQPVSHPPSGSHA